MLSNYPVNARFGDYGGRYVPETLVPAIEELERAYDRYKNDTDFRKELR
jgi:tryptophan synthase beta chain